MKNSLTSRELIADIFHDLASHPDLNDPWCYSRKWRKAICKSFDPTFWGKAEWFYLVCVADLTGWIYENSPILAWNHCETVDEMAACFDAFPGWKYRGGYVPQCAEACLITTALPGIAKLYGATEQISRADMEKLGCDFARVFSGLEIVYPSDF
jgi:hypothetical protein